MSYETKEELLQLGEIDADLDAILKANPLPTVSYDDIQIAKDMSAKRLPLLLAALGDAPAGVRQTDTTYTTRDGVSKRARIYQPTKPPADGSALVVLIHGGGFCVGTVEGEEQTARNLVLSYGAVCVSISYRLAPEHPFPYAINDVWDALKFFGSRAQELAANPSVGFIVGGTSAGGNLAAVAAHKARDENLQPPLTGQWLSIPATCPESRIPEQYKKYYYSYDQNEFVPVLPKAAADMFYQAYKPDPDDAENFATLNHPLGHKGLAPAFLQICGLDPLRDEGLIYERVLREEAGVPTKMIVYPGLPHAFWAYFPTLASSKQYRKDQVEGFGWLLKKEPKVFEGEFSAGASTA